MTRFSLKYGLLGLLLVLGPRSALLAQPAIDEEEGVRIFTPAYYDEFDPVTALELVFRTPGFNPQEDDGGRGLSGVRSNILIDGSRPPPKGQSARQQLREMPVYGVERVELIDTGARPGIDMQGFPQVVNVVTVSDPPAYYEIVSEVRRAGTGDVQHENERNIELQATGSFNWNAHEFTLRGEKQDSSDRSPADVVAIDPANPVQRISSLNTSERTDQGIELSADFELPNESSLSFNGDFGDESRSSSPLVLIEDPDAPDAIEESYSSEEDQRDISTEYRRPLASNGSIMVAYVDAVSTDASESSLVDGSLARSSVEDRESGERAARILLTQSPTERLTVRTTATSAFNYFEGGFRIFENGTELEIDGSDSRVEEDRRSLETEVDWNFASRWTLRGSLGTESYHIETRDHSSGTQTDPKGYVLVSYRPQSRTTMSFESRREIGQLSFGQFLASSNLSSEILTAGAAELEPERSWAHSATYDRRFGDVGVLQLELSRNITDNPVRSVALTDSIVVAQNTSEQTIDRFRASVEYPFERWGREDFVLGFNVNFRDSETIDPVTGETREVNGVTRRFYNIQFRRDPGDGPLSWGMSYRKGTGGSNFSVRNIREWEPGEEWEAYVEWEPIEGLRFRTQLQGPRTEIQRAAFFPAVRAAGLNPSFYATTVRRIDRSASLSVEWRRRDHFEIRASLSSRPEILTEESLIPFGEVTGSVLATEIARTPRATLRFRVYR